MLGLPKCQTSLCDSSEALCFVFALTEAEQAAALSPTQWDRSLCHAAGWLCDGSGCPTGGSSPEKTPGQLNLSQLD